MAIYFFDSSALIKCYVSESGSTWSRRIFNDPANTIVICELSIAEVASALAQLRHAKRFGHSFMRATWQRFQTDLRQRRFSSHPVDLATLNFAAQLALRHPLKGCDAIQVSAAIQTGKFLQMPVIFTSSDKQTIRATSAEGISIDNPFDHTGEDQQA